MHLGARPRSCHRGTPPDPAVPSETSPPLPTPLPPVLVAEDEPDIGELLKLILEHHGCDVTVVGNGEDAILAAQSRPFRFVMLDAMMPVMSGIEAAAVMRRRWPKMRIVMHTAMDEAWVRERFTAYYVYFRKPLEIERFLDRLPELMKPR